MQHRRRFIAGRVQKPFVLPRVPQAALLWWLWHNARVGISGIIAVRALPEGLILDDEWNPEPVAPIRKLLPIENVRIGQHTFQEQLIFDVIRDKVRAGETGVDIGAREPIRVIVIPDHPRALVVGIVVSCSSRSLARRRPVDETWAVHEATVGRIRVGIPCERAAVAVPKDKPAVEVNRNAVLPTDCSGRGIDDRCIYR